MELAFSCELSVDMTPIRQCELRELTNYRFPNFKQCSLECALTAESEETDGKLNSHKQ